MSWCRGNHETRRRRCNDLRRGRLAIFVQSEVTMRRLLPLVLAVIATGTAHAQPASAVSAPVATEPAASRPFALAINMPVTWRRSVGASAWVGWDEHHAIRANFARYRGPLWPLIPALLESDNDEVDGRANPDFGHTTDLSLGWVYYPRRVLDGATVEAGALLRLNHLRDDIDAQNRADEELFTNVYSARVLIGWTWRLSDWWFVATSVGASAGYEHGRQKSFVGYDSTPGHFMTITKDERVSRLNASLEAYLRIGLAFGQ